MPNDVYGTARRELAALVSVRAAERVLDDALASVDVSRDAVTARQMRALIAGPVQKELCAILPRTGLNRVLRRIVEDLRAMSPTTTPAAPSPVAPPYSAPPYSAPPVDEANPPTHSGPSSAATSSSTASPPRPSVEAPGQASETPGHTAVAPVRPAKPIPAPLAGSDLSLEQVERIALAFARLEHVRGVTVLRRGEVAFARGTGIDPTRAAAMVPAAAKIIARHGGWRSLGLVHDRGQLFIIPAGRDFIVLSGRSEFNLGAVLTALARLEEES